MFAMSRITLSVLLSLFTISLCENVVYERAAPKSYPTINTAVKGCVLRATINNPPINLYDNKLSLDLASLVNSLKSQTDIKVVILASANSDYWIAHEDVNLLSTKAKPPPSVNGTEVALRLLSTANLIATLPVIFIAEINGRATATGNELAVRCDIRYAGPGTHLSQYEVGFNFVPGVGGVEYLVKLIGRARALEYILSGRSVDAVTAAGIGWVNRAFSSPKQLRSEVDALADRIASFSEPALAAIKQRINASSLPKEKTIADTFAVFSALNGRPEAQAAGARYLKLSENQRGNAFELALPARLQEVNG